MFLAPIVAVKSYKNDLCWNDVGTSQRWAAGGNSWKGGSSPCSPCVSTAMSGRCCCCSLWVRDLKRKGLRMTMDPAMWLGVSTQEKRVLLLVVLQCCLQRGLRVALLKELMGSWSSMRQFYWTQPSQEGGCPASPSFFQTVWCASPQQLALGRQVMPERLQAMHFLGTDLLWFLSLLRWEFKALLMQSNHWCSPVSLYWVLRGSVCPAFRFCVLLSKWLTPEI